VPAAGADDVRVHRDDNESTGVIACTQAECKELIAGMRGIEALLARQDQLPHNSSALSVPTAGSFRSTVSAAAPRLLLRRKLV
jgi:hypothetical protein